MEFFSSSLDTSEEEKKPCEDTWHIWWLRTLHAAERNLGGPLSATIKAALFFFLLTPGNVYNTKMPSLRNSSCVQLHNRKQLSKAIPVSSSLPGVWTPVQVVLFVLRTCSVLAEAHWSKWTEGSLGFTERLMCSWASHCTKAHLIHPWIGSLKVCEFF